MPVGIVLSDLRRHSIDTLTKVVGREKSFHRILPKA
jgi:hypothetical protein